MNTDNDQLKKRYRQSGKWVNDIPVNVENKWCSKCKEKLGKAKRIKFTISGLKWKPYRFEYHESCVINALKDKHNTFSMKEN